MKTKNSIRIEYSVNSETYKGTSIRIAAFQYVASGGDVDQAFNEIQHCVEIQRRRLEDRHCLYQDPDLQDPTPEMGDF